jgi:hypothetical protein
MQIHQPIPYGLLYSVDPKELAKFQLSEQANHDDFDWKEYESGYAGESLAGNVLSFLKEFASA